MTVAEYKEISKGRKKFLSKPNYLLRGTLMILDFFFLPYNLRFEILVDFK